VVVFSVQLVFRDAPEHRDEPPTSQRSHSAVAVRPRSQHARLALAGGPGVPLTDASKCVGRVNPHLTAKTWRARSVLALMYTGRGQKMSRVHQKDQAPVAVGTPRLRQWCAEVLDAV
jgi:hypothetical protein